MKIEILVPATTANLGAGFDCLGMALDLFNETFIEITESGGVQVEIEGEGAEMLAKDEKNLIFRTFKQTCEKLNETSPKNLAIRCKNSIPLRSGLGSSAAATLTGILAANQYLGNKMTDNQIIELGAEIEGHADNITPALMGGLTVTAETPYGKVFRQIEVPRWQAVVVLPDVNLSTEEARKALPKKVSLDSAVFNIGQTVLTVEALQQGSLKQLQESMKDKLHQPYRLPLIPGAEEAIKAAEGLGGAAALSGAGPSVVALGLKDMEQIGEAMQKAFAQKEIKSRVFILAIERRKVAARDMGDRRD